MDINNLTLGTVFSFLVSSFVCFLILCAMFFILSHIAQAMRSTNVDSSPQTWMIVFRIVLKIVVLAIIPAVFVPLTWDYGWPPYACMIVFGLVVWQALEPKNETAKN